MNGSGAKRAFFRQSGWMAVAALAGGMFNMASNFVAQRMPQGQFNIFDTALSALGILAIPALGMQASFAAQSAGVDNEQQRRQLTAAIRGAFGLLGLVWLALAAVWFVREKQIMAAYSLSQPLMLWMLLFICLVTMLTPVPSGVLQGRQDFFWYGWATLLNGLGRFAVLLLVVRGMGYGALGGLAGVLAGSVLVLGIVGWRAWDAVTGPTSEFAWSAWLKRLLPVTVGLGALSFIMQADALVVREKLRPFLSPDEVDGYSAVRKIAQAMVFLIGALTNVMFPKVARSFQRAEETQVLRWTLGLTAGIGVAGATLATLFPSLPLRLLSPDRLMASQVLVPAYCWALLPMALSSVLVWSLLARECYRVVPWLAGLALGYWLALQALASAAADAHDPAHVQDRLFQVIGIAAAFGLALFAVCSAFAWLNGRTERAARTRLQVKT